MDGTAGPSEEFLRRIGDSPEAPDEPRVEGNLGNRSAGATRGFRGWQRRWAIARQPGSRIKRSATPTMR